ncbi:MAG: flagellar basal body P-ring formation chaperone FlgA [Thermodesulfobacteriota bacterium]
MSISIRTSLFARFAAALLCCLLLPAASQAGSIGSALNEADLERIFTEAVLANSPWRRQDVEITNFSARPTEVALPAGRISHRVSQPPSDGQPGRKSIVVIILADDREVAQVRLNGDLRLYGNVVHTTRRLGRGETITDDAVAVRRQDISMQNADLIQEPSLAVGRAMKASVPAGAVLHRQLVAEPHMVARGETVSIVARTSTVRVSTPGMAKEAGALGETIRVKNLTSRKEIMARVAGAGLVETEF